MRHRVMFMSALLLTSAATLAVAQDAVVRQIEAAEQAFDAARLKGDKRAYERMLHDDFTWITRTGNVTNKQQQVVALVPDSPSQRLSRQIKVYGDTAVVGTSVTRTGQGKPVRIFVTHVWIKQGPEWKLVLHQGSTIQGEGQ